MEETVKCSRHLSMCLTFPGEWGGFFKENDIERRWAEAFVDYLLSIGATDQFFWCMNPNSGMGGRLNTQNQKMTHTKTASAKSVPKFSWNLIFFLPEVSNKQKHSL